MNRPWSSTLHDITAEAGKAFAQLHALWEEGNLNSQGRIERMNAIHQELQNFWKETIQDEMMYVLKCKILQLREEIKLWWEKCFLSEEERADFEEYKSTEFTELLLESHEKELQRLKRKYTNNQRLFALIKKHQDTWNRVVDMDKQLYNPERLFQNRGAQLLQEERDRKAAQKDLPKLEDQIKKATENFEKENGMPFRVFGRRFSEMIKYQKEQHKENQKLMRSNQENAMQQYGVLPKHSCPTKHGQPKRCADCVPPTAGPVHPKATTVTKKRKIVNTPSPMVCSTQSKMARIATYDQVPSKFARSLKGRHESRVRRKLIERSNNIPQPTPAAGS